MRRKLCKAAILFAVGAAVYWLVEFGWRSLVNTLPVHWTMPVLGGALFLLLGGINEYLPWEMSLARQALIGTAVITVAEFAAGCILNLGVGLAIWDYSHLPLNLLGQICLGFCVAWVPLSVVGIVLDDWVRYWWFGQERPHYVLFGGWG